MIWDTVYFITSLLGQPASDWQRIRPLGLEASRHALRSSTLQHAPGTEGDLGNLNAASLLFLRH